MTEGSSIRRRALGLALSAVVTAALFGTLAIVLTSRVPDVRDRHLAQERPGWTSVPVALQRANEEEGVTLQRLRLYVTTPSAVLDVPEIDILFATWGREEPIPIVRGSLDVAGCRYASPAGERVRDNAIVRFVRTAPCAPPPEPSGDMVLTMQVTPDSPLAVWAFQPPAPARGDELVFIGGAPDGAAALPVLRGRYVERREASRVRRVDLLAYTWQIGETPSWIGGVVAAAGLLFLIGVATVQPFRFTRSGDGGVGQPLSAGALALSLGLLYAVIVPPFQAPDEPHHFLAFADLVGSPALATQAADLGRAGHLQRIKFQILEKFRPVHLGRPLAEGWDADTLAMPVGERSRTTELLWRAIGGLMPGRRAPDMLLALRAINALVFALAVAAGVALLRAVRADPTVACAALLVPALPFFAVHVSEFALLTSTYVVFACVVAGLFVDGPRTHRLGFPFGLCCALMLAGGRAAAPMVAVIAAVLVARAVLGTREAAVEPSRPSGDWRRALQFWGGAGAGASLLLLLSTEAYTRGLFPRDASQAAGWFRSAAQLLREQSWLLVLLVAAGLFVEIGAARLRSRLRRRVWDAGRGARVLAYGLAVTLTGIAVASLFVKMPRLSRLVFTRDWLPPLRPYVGDVLAVFSTSIRLRHPDFFLSTSFWGAFGWTETMLPEGMVSALVGLFGAIAVLLLVRVGRARDVRRFAWILVLVAGSLSAMVLYAVSSHYLYRNLHGRYLVGLYLTGLTVILTAPFLTRSVAASGPNGPRGAWLAVAGLAAAIHAVALTVVLRRYF